MAARRSGSIVAYDHDLKPMYEYTFKEALILETTIPTLDASSKEMAYMTIKFQPDDGGAPTAALAISTAATGA